MSFLFLVLIYKERVCLFLPCILIGRDGLLVFLVSFVALCFFIPQQAFYRYRWPCYLFSAYLCICFFHSFCMPSILIPCARVGGFTIIPYIYAFLIPEHSLNLSFHLFLVSKFLQCTFFHSPSFFHHSFVLVCLLHLGDPLNLYFRLVHFRLVCLGRTRGGLAWSLGSVIYSIFTAKASVLYIDLYIRTYIHMHILLIQKFSWYTWTIL